jgi:hypothetical protein
MNWDIAILILTDPLWVTSISVNSWAVAIRA